MRQYDSRQMCSCYLSVPVFFGYTRVSETYTVCTLMKFVCDWQKIGHKSKCRKDSESTFFSPHIPIYASCYRNASFISFTYAATYGTQSFPYCPHSFTIAEPTIAPSDWPAIFFACSGVEIPKPTAHGISFAAFTSLTIDPISVVMLERIPVTPSDDTQ